jgi:succinate dehydrogenase / fumarate reductase flavoprotein subunit
MAISFCPIPSTTTWQQLEAGCSNDTIDHPEFDKVENEVGQHIDRLLSINGHKTVDDFHRELGQGDVAGMCAMSRNKEGLEKGIQQIENIKEAFLARGEGDRRSNELNTELEKALRLADFIELGY